MNSNRKQLEISDIPWLIRPWQRSLPAGYSPDDHAHDVILRLLRYSGEWSPQLVKTIARNLAIDSARRAAFREAPYWSDHGDCSGAHLKDPHTRSPSDEREAEECRELVRRRVAQLKPRYREVIRRNFFGYESFR